MSASTDEYSLSIVWLMPPNIARRIIMAAVGIAAAMTLTMAIMLITECDFGENI